MEAKWASIFFLNHPLFVCFLSCYCVCVWMCVSADSIHPSIQSFENMFTPVWVYQHHIPPILLTSQNRLWALEMTEMTLNPPKPLTPGNIPVLASLKRTGASFQKTPALLSFLSLTPFPLSFSPSPPHGCNFTPSTELEAYWNTSPWSSLHFKVDFHPRARSEGAVRRGKGPAPE